MSNMSINSNMPCYHLDLSAKKATFGKYDYANLLAQQAQMAEEERNNPQIGTATLTEQEIQDLAGKYDPANMTNAEYNSFINDLVSKGILGRSETYGIYSDRVVLRPGHLSEGGISSSPVHTLADMGGDALQWTSIMSQWRGGSFDTVRADAFQKISSILQEMNTYRLEQEKVAEDAAKADEQLATMDRAIYEQKKNIDSAEIKSAAERKAMIEAADTVAESAAPRSRTLTEAANEAIANAPPGAIQVFLPNDKTVCSYGYGTDQYVYAEYTEDSTAEDPIVRIYCRAKSGTYEYTCHLNDVDPENATYAELAALNGHQMKLENPDAIGGKAVPTGYEIGDMMQRQNFMTGLEDLSHSKMFSQGILTDAKEFLQFYAGLIEEKKQQLEETAEFEALMDAVDNVTEGRAPMEPEEILERLSEPAKDTLEDIKADKEVSREEWSGLLEELRDMGAISDTELGYTRGFRLIPLGYRNENGELVRYESAGRFAEARLLQLAGLETSEDAVVDWNWNNDPLAFLDDWITELTEWRDDLARERSASGAPKYDDFSPIDDQVAACNKVSELVKGLVAQTE